MKPDFNKLLKKHQSHTTLLDEKSVLDALEESYQIGKKHSEGEYSQLKDAFKSLLYEYTHKGKIQKSVVLMVEEWEKKAGIYLKNI